MVFAASNGLLWLNNTDEWEELEASSSAIPGTPRCIAKLQSTVWRPMVTLGLAIASAVPALVWHVGLRRDCGMGNFKPLCCCTPHRCSAKGRIDVGCCGDQCVSCDSRACCQVCWHSSRTTTTRIMDDSLAFWLRAAVFSPLFLPAVWAFVASVLATQKAAFTVAAEVDVVSHAGETAVAATVHYSMANGRGCLSSASGRLIAAGYDQEDCFDAGDARRLALRPDPGATLPGDVDLSAEVLPLTVSYSQSVAHWAALQSVASGLVMSGLVALAFCNIRFGGAMMAFRKWGPWFMGVLLLLSLVALGCSSMITSLVTEMLMQPELSKRLTSGNWKFLASLVWPISEPLHMTGIANSVDVESPVLVPVLATSITAGATAMLVAVLTCCVACGVRRGHVSDDHPDEMLLAQYDSISEDSPCGRTDDDASSAGHGSSRAVPPAAAAAASFRGAAPAADGRSKISSRLVSMSTPSLTVLLLERGQPDRISAAKLHKATEEADAARRETRKFRVQAAEAQARVAAQALAQRVRNEAAARAALEAEEAGASLRASQAWLVREFTETQRRLDAAERDARELRARHAEEAAARFHAEQAAADAVVPEDFIRMGPAAPSAPGIELQPAAGQFSWAPQSPGRPSAPRPNDYFA